MVLSEDIFDYERQFGEGFWIPSDWKLADLGRTQAPRSSPARLSVPPRANPAFQSDPVVAKAASTFETREKTRGANRSPDMASTASETLVSDDIRQRILARMQAKDASSLEDLRTQVQSCVACKLCDGRTNTVFGEGNARASLMWIGEGPGRDEDASGRPFVGKAGQLLTDIIEKGMRLARAEVYITNIVKCRPPQNRDPLPEETTACRPFLDQQIERIAPKIIVTLGAHATHTLLGTKAPMATLRGNWVQYNNGIWVMPTWHPAYLLREPAAKKQTWADVQAVTKKLEEL